MKARSLLPALSDLQKTKSLEEAKGQVSAALAEIGISAFVCSSRLADGRWRHLTNVPDEWMRAYVEANLQQVDPVMYHALTTLLPFRWEESLGDRKYSDRELEVFAIAAANGHREGGTIPVHGPGGEAGYLSVGLGMDLTKANELWQANMTALQSLAIALHEVQRRFAGLGRGDANAIVLSSRERECLTWIARGLTVAQASEELGISSGTVRFHVTNAAKKLGVTSRSHAAVRATQLQLIHP